MTSILRDMEEEVNDSNKTRSRKAALCSLWKFSRLSCIYYLLFWLPSHFEASSSCSESVRPYRTHLLSCYDTVASMTRYRQACVAPTARSGLGRLRQKFVWTSSIRTMLHCLRPLSKTSASRYFSSRAESHGSAGFQVENSAVIPWSTIRVEASIG